MIRLCAQCGGEPVNAGGLLGDACWWANVEAAAAPAPPAPRPVPELLTLF